MRVWPWWRRISSPRRRARARARRHHVLVVWPYRQHGLVTPPLPPSAASILRLPLPLSAWHSLPQGHRNHHANVALSQLFHPPPPPHFHSHCATRIRTTGRQTDRQTDRQTEIQARMSMRWVGRRGWAGVCVGRCGVYPSSPGSCVPAALVAKTLRGALPLRLFGSLYLIRHRYYTLTMMRDTE